MTATQPKRPGRRPGESNARQEILDAARALMASIGPEATSLRAVARRADVDPALVSHYFGDRATLIAEAMVLPDALDRAVSLVVPGPRAAMGHRLATFFLSIWEDPRQREPIMGLLRGATTSPGVADLLRETLHERVLGPIGDRLDVPDAALRMSLCSSQLVGLGIARYIVCIEPLASLSPAEAIDSIAPTLQRYLTGRI